MKPVKNLQISVTLISHKALGFLRVRRRNERADGEVNYSNDEDTEQSQLCL